MVSSKRKPNNKSKKTKLVDDFPRLCFSVELKDRGIKLSDDRMSAIGHKGFSTVLATQGASQKGKWYYEAVLLPGEASSSPGHCRIGWSTRLTRFDMPIGSDQFSYSIRDVDGSKVLEGRRTPYSELAGLSGISPGDVIGCLLELPSPPSGPLLEDTDPSAEERLRWLPGLLCDPEKPPKLSKWKGGSLTFSVNGRSLGVAFDAIVEGSYYPAVSLFQKSKVQLRLYEEDMQFLPDGYTAIGEIFVPEGNRPPKYMPSSFVPRGRRNIDALVSLQRSEGSTNVDSWSGSASKKSRKEEEGKQEGGKEVKVEE